MGFLKILKGTVCIIEKYLNVFKEIFIQSDNKGHDKTGEISDVVIRNPITQESHKIKSEVLHVHIRSKRIAYSNMKTDTGSIEIAFPSCIVWQV